MQRIPHAKLHFLQFFIISGDLKSFEIQTIYAITREFFQVLIMACYQQFGVSRATALRRKNSFILLRDHLTAAVR